MSSAYWYQYATTSNRIKQTYVNGFLDVSGDLVVRNNNFNINGLISQNTDSAATNAQYTYISWNDVSGTFATVGNPTFSNNITVNQNTKTATLSVTGDSSLNKLFLNGNLAVGKTAVTSGTTLDVSGVALVSSKLAINNATYASMTNSSNNTRVLVTGDSTGTNADVSGQIVLTGSTDTNSRMGFMLDTTTTNFPIGKIQVNQTNVGGGQRLALNPAGGKVGITAVPDASGTQLEVAGGIASKEPTTGNAGVGTFVKTMTAGNWYKLAQCGDPQSKVTFRVVGLVTYQNNTYNIDVTTTYNNISTAPISSILLNNTIGSNVFTDANIDFVVVYDSTNQTSSYYIKCNSNTVYCALTIYVTTKNTNGNYSKLRFYQDRVFTLSYASSISTSVDTELSGSITQFVISTHANTTYPMVVSSAGNVAIGKTTATVALDVSGIVKQSVWESGQVIQAYAYSSSLGNSLNSSTVVTDTNYATATNTVFSFTVNPKSINSIIYITFDCVSTISGNGNDTLESRILVTSNSVDTEIAKSAYTMTSSIDTTYGRKKSQLFPLIGAYKNTSNSSISVKIQAKRVSSDDNTAIESNLWSCYYQEIQR